MKRMQSMGEMTEPRGTPELKPYRIEEEAIHSDGNRPIIEETTNPINESVMETKHR